MRSLWTHLTGLLPSRLHFAVLGVAAWMCLNATASADSIEFVVNAPDDHEYARLSTMPADFGSGEFTLELWVRPDEHFPVGDFSQGDPDQLTDWYSGDPQPYSSDSWWFRGNFLLDGHNNNSFEDGTFSVQFYGGGRVRWLFGDGTNAGAGRVRAVQADPASSTDDLLDARWHRITLVRVWTEASSASLELWVDGQIVAVQTTPARTDMRTYWDAWSGFPDGQAGWFFGAEKQAAIGILSQYEDYKGYLDEIRFYNRALSVHEIETGVADTLGLVGSFSFSEGSGNSSCDELDGSLCIQLANFSTEPWDTADAGDDDDGHHDHDHDHDDSWASCVVVAAAYGTPLYKDLDVLRAFRDRRLLSNSIGAAIADGYYRVSPCLADALARHPSAAGPVRGAIRLMLALTTPSASEHESSSVGIAATGLAFVFLGRRMAKRGFAR